MGVTFRALPGYIFIWPNRVAPGDILDDSIRAGAAGVNTGLCWKGWVGRTGLKWASAHRNPHRQLASADRGSRREFVRRSCLWFRSRIFTRRPAAARPCRPRSRKRSTFWRTPALRSHARNSTMRRLSATARFWPSIRTFRRSSSTSAWPSSRAGVSAEPLGRSRRC